MAQQDSCHSKEPSGTKRLMFSGKNCPVVCVNLLCMSSWGLVFVSNEAKNWCHAPIYNPGTPEAEAGGS